MQPTTDDVDAYLASSDDLAALRELDAVVAAGLPGVRRTLWRGTFWGGTEQVIIGYGDLAQHRPDGRVVDWFWVGVAQQKRNLSLYVNAVEDGRYLSQGYGARLGKVKVGASAVTFRSPADLDLPVVTEMLSRVLALMRNG
jgi:hypothetical protein